MGVLRFHSSSKNVATLIGDLSARPDVQYVEPNYIVRAIATPNDPYFSQLWGLHNTGQTILGQPGKPGADISAVEAWDISTGSRANVVAVVDTGIDYTHPDLAANVWSAPRTFIVNIGGLPIVCPAGSHGFNAVTNLCDPLDDNGHGTHTSGTIGAVGNNGIGVVGVNWHVTIMPCKFLNYQGSGSTSGAIACLDYFATMKDLGYNIVATNNSWGGGGYSQGLYDAIKENMDRGILFIAAAGNGGGDGVGDDNDQLANYPSNFDLANVIAVAATTSSDLRANFSNFGRHTVHLGAPGQQISSTLPGGVYGTYSGTSMATPHVTGTAALLKAYNPSL